MGIALRNHRTSRSLTLQQAAALIGIDHTNLSRIERGMQNASTDMLLRLANAYGVTLGQLFQDV
ncbi:MAG TPA: helix-turn-helix transcriptional regulator, partial [Noviherbaspirillum sp.]